MSALTKYLILFLVTFSTPLYAAKLAIHDLHKKKIGVINIVGDFATLAYEASSKHTANENRTGITYYDVAHWNVGFELNHMLSDLLKKNKYPGSVDLSKHKTRITAGFHTQNNRIGQKYLATLATMPQLKGIDYLLFIYPTPEILPELKQFVFTAGEVITQFNYAADQDPKLITYGFSSSHDGGINSFMTAAFELIEIKSASSIRKDKILQQGKFDYEKTSFNDETKRYIYQLFKEHIVKEIHLIRARSIIFKPQLYGDDIAELKNVFKQGFEGEYEDDLNSVLHELDTRLVTNIITPKEFSRAIANNGAREFDLHIETMQKAFAEQVLNRIKGN